MTRWLMRWAALALGILSAADAVAQRDPLGCLPQDTPGWVQPRPALRSSAVVFLHGLHGDGRATWIAPGAAAWPCLVTGDEGVFGKSAVYLTSYRTRPGEPNPSTTEAARRVALDLATDGVFDHPQVSVVAHSMGGIVLARMLTTPGLLSDEQRRRIRLVLFVGTPAQPTEAATICSKFGINEQCTEMGDERQMSALWSAWDRLPARPAAWCMAEGANMWWFPSWTLSMRIVPQSSAFRPCRHPDYQQVAHGLDHSDVAKPVSSQVEPHRTLRNAFAACVRPSLTPAVAARTAPDGLPAAASRWFYDLKGRLERERNDWTPLLSQTLATDVNRYWYPEGHNPSFDIEHYERLGANAFVQVLRPALAELLSSAEFDWAVPVQRVHERVSDGAMDALIERMRDRGGLSGQDVIGAVRFRQREVDGQWLMVLRPGPAPAAGFALLGVLAVPRPTNDCRT
ncbi:MAG: hypothetical protein U1F56_16670 [Rubrivivax sp.]